MFVVYRANYHLKPWSVRHYVGSTVTPEFCAIQCSELTDCFWIVPGTPL